jgi:hypothetical protein
VSHSLTIPERFNGPLDSGNGGYCSGVVASFVDGPAEVSLRSPVPLDRQLEVATGDDGLVRMVDGETLIAEARPTAPLELEVPAPVAPDDARAAMQRYRGLDTGPFRRCFVCGRAREDAFGVFAGKVDGRDLVASTWTPPESAADDRGNVRAELIWAVLDCPTYFAAHLDDDLSLSFLVRLAARIDAPVVAEREHVVVAWPIESEGRKRRAGAALMTGEGETLAIADALLVEPRASA